MVNVLSGSNFSGRSERIRERMETATGTPSCSAAFIGPDPSSSFSSLATTLRGELSLYDASQHCGFIETLNILDLVDRELDTLSGGEQTLCALACAIALQPSAIGIDCALEQLDPRR